MQPLCCSLHADAAPRRTRFQLSLHQTITAKSVYSRVRLARTGLVRPHACQTWRRAQAPSAHMHVRLGGARRPRPLRFQPELRAGADSRILPKPRRQRRRHVAVGASVPRQRRRRGTASGDSCNASVLPSGGLRGGFPGGGPHLCCALRPNSGVAGNATAVLCRAVRAVMAGVLSRCRPFG